MIPDNNISLKNGINVVSFPTHTYKLNFEQSKVSQYTDGLEAMEQMVYKALQTYRYRHEIYNWNYGVELDDLFGKSKLYAKAEIKRRIKECLMADDRVKSVDSFEFEEADQNLGNDRRTTVCVRFNVKTIFGNLTANKDVII